MRLAEQSPYYQHNNTGTRGRWKSGIKHKVGRLYTSLFTTICLPFSVLALVPGGHRQQSMCDVHGGVWSRCVAGVAGQCTGQIVPRSDLGEPDRGGRGSCRAQDARR